MDADEPLANPRHETYCHERVASRTQRQAKLAAWRKAQSEKLDAKKEAVK